MEIINRAVFKLGKEHYHSSIGPLEPLILEIFLAKTPCHYMDLKEKKHVYAGYYNLINSRNLPSQILIQDSITEEQMIAESRFLDLYHKLAKKFEKKEKILKIKDEKTCALYD